MVRRTHIVFIGIVLNSNNSALSTAVKSETDRPSALQFLELRKQISIESIVKSRKIFDVKRNLVSNTWTADRESS